VFNRMASGLIAASASCRLRRLHLHDLKVAHLLARVCQFSFLRYQVHHWRSVFDDFHHAISIGFGRRQRRRLGSGSFATADGSLQFTDLNSLSFTVAVTPLPDALPLFATGLGVLALLGWRRKRTARSVAV
jgi:hypothetical protein